MKKVFVTGGAGYVGAVLVPKLLKAGYEVKVLDLYLYGEDVFHEYKSHPHLIEIKGDLRDVALLEREIAGMDAVIHLACISNDPSYELNPALGKSINYDAFLPLVAIAKQHKVSRFIFASSSSVYGLKDDPHVTEDLPLAPLTDYSKYKAMCEKHLLAEQAKDFIVVILRPATVCGYSPRLRLDLTVNILTNHAINKGLITVFGGKQKRPNIHIEDVTDLYVQTLELPPEKIAGQIFNAGYENHTLDEIADMVRQVIKNPHLKIVHQTTDDNRSYHISSEKIGQALGFRPRHTIEHAVADLKQAFAEGKIPDAMTDSKYYNIKTMQKMELQ